MKQTEIKLTKPDDFGFTDTDKIQRGVKTFFYIVAAMLFFGGGFLTIGTIGFMENNDFDLLTVILRLAFGILQMAVGVTVAILADKVEVD